PPLSLHDALPISPTPPPAARRACGPARSGRRARPPAGRRCAPAAAPAAHQTAPPSPHLHSVQVEHRDLARAQLAPLPGPQAVLPGHPAPLSRRHVAHAVQVLVLVRPRHPARRAGLAGLTASAGHAPLALALLHLGQVPDLHRRSPPWRLRCRRTVAGDSPSAAAI